MKNELTHHGILGQRKGKRNGPPYPIQDYSKFSAEERAAMKEKAIRQGNVREANKNKDYFTDNELKAVRDRFKLNEDIRDLSKKDIKSGQQKAQELADKFNTAHNLANAVANLTGDGIKLYNQFGAIHAHATKTEFKPINIGGGGKKKDKGK